MSRTESAMPVANSASAMRQVLRLSLCTMAMAISAHGACSKRPAQFDRGHRRLADDDALAARHRCRLERSDDFVLPRPLTFVSGCYGERALRCLDQRRWQSRESRVLPRHSRPFLIDGVVDVLGHKRANPSLRFGGKACGQQVDGTKGARLSPLTPSTRLAHARARKKSRRKAPSRKW